MAIRARALGLRGPAGPQGPAGGGGGVAIQYLPLSGLPASPQGGIYAFRTAIFHAGTGNLYVAERTARNAVYAINPATGVVVAEILCATAPVALVYVPSVDRIFASAGVNVIVINPNTNAVVATIAGMTSLTTAGMYCASNNSVYFADNTNLRRVACASNTLAATIALATTSVAVAYAANADRVYVIGNTPIAVKVINPATDAIVTTLLTPTLINAAAQGVFYTSVSGRIHLVFGGTIQVLETAGNTILRVYGAPVGSPGQMLVLYVAVLDRAYFFNTAVGIGEYTMLDGAECLLRTMLPALNISSGVGDYSGGKLYMLPFAAAGPLHVITV